MTRPFVSLTTDFGLADPSVGICKGVILRIAPDAQIVDVSHAIHRQNPLEGAALLQAALPYLPTGVHLAVVDPGVGTERRPVAVLTARGDHLVGPDNGLLVPGAEALGGIEACCELADERYRLSPVSRTFHGRDIFAPAAAHLALGVALEEFGPAVDPRTLARLELPTPLEIGGKLEATILSFDAFGSAQLLAGQVDLERALGTLARGTRLFVEIGTAPAARSFEATWRRTYGEVAAGETLVLVDSYGRLAIAVNGGDAAARHGLRSGERVRLGRG